MASPGMALTAGGVFVVGSAFQTGATAEVADTLIGDSLSWDDAGPEEA